MLFLVRHATPSNARRSRGLLSLIALFSLLGVMGIKSLVKEDLPDLEIPMALVTTKWTGSDAASIDKAITDKLEAEINTITTLKAMRSASFDSFSMITVEFDANADIETRIYCIL